ncbi:peptide chain release factor 2 [Gracilibacillus halophilus YIM-C55.5]|uniref:Peptide chain release factor 2 n=1 Tax=Gracilibacillus halophilus YIM-C55.5 TaxID=1308866 RepID=N4WQL9_9BACI|nr:peptide chain release factor 2 [Gracilibacillus halophilus YIM-C55.5]
MTKWRSESRTLGGLFDLETKRARIAELEEQMTDPSFWDDPDVAQKVINEANGLKQLVETYDRNKEKLENAEVSYELVKEENDEELRSDLEEEVKALSDALNEFELYILLSDPYDQNNAILELHPGAGGTESQDWANMLLRMYTRWLKQKDLK